MTRLELLKILVGQARANGFEFRRWCSNYLGLPWSGADAAFASLAQHRRYYSLLFSHEFARTFWKAGAPMTFQIPETTFSRVHPNGTTVEVRRKAFMRRTARNDVWRYHLREMAATAEPLRYIRRFLPVEEELDGRSQPLQTVAEVQAATKTLALARRAQQRRQQERELDAELAARKATPRAVPRRKAQS